MKAIITTFDAHAVTLSLAAAGTVEDAEVERLHELFRSSAVVVELHVEPGDQDGSPRVTVAAGNRTEGG